MAEVNMGGEVKKFKDAGEVEKEGKSGIMDLDITPFIPPQFRFTEDLTPREIIEGAGEFSQEMAKYLTPGLGEHLSHRDYLQFSQSAEEAAEQGKTLASLGFGTIAALAMTGTIPNWTVVGAAPNAVLGAFKGVKKFVKRVGEKKLLPAPKTEKRYVVKDQDGNTIVSSKDKTKAEAMAEQRFFIMDEQGRKVGVALTMDEGQMRAIEFNKKKGGRHTVMEDVTPVSGVVEMDVPIKVKKKITGLPAKMTNQIDPVLVIGAGDSKLYYSQLDELLTPKVKGQQNTMAVRRASGSTENVPVETLAMSADEWERTFRSAGIREAELGDSYIRELLNRKGKWNKETQAFTSAEPITYAEIKALADESPSRFLQSSSYSTKDGNLKYGSSGRSSGYKTDTAEEHVLWIDSKDIKGDTGKISSDLRTETQQHANLKKVETDVNFATKNKLDGEPYIIGWSLVDVRPGKTAMGKNVNVSTASEMQSDMLQKLAARKKALKGDLTAKLEELSNLRAVDDMLGFAQKARRVEELKTELENLVRPLGLSSMEVDNLLVKMNKNAKIFHDASKLSPLETTPDILKQLKKAAVERDQILFDLNGRVDTLTLKQMFPNVPLKNQKQWVDALIKNDVYMAAKNRFTILDDGTVQINKNAPSHYSVTPSSVVKKRWGGEEREKFFDILYGGPDVKASLRAGETEAKHFTSHVEEALKRVASDKNAAFQYGKVQFGGNMENAFMIELTPEMLTSHVQYFKVGGLVEKIPQYTSLQSVLDVLGPIGAN